MLARPLQDLVDQLARLPSIGRKSAQRLAFHLLQQDRELSDSLARAIIDAKTRLKPCAQCGNFSEQPLCPICSDNRRNPNLICVVERPTDILAIEKGSHFKGLYHVLGGVISPLDGVTPDHLSVESLLQRINTGDEVILSMGTSTEGDHTAFYLTRRLKQNGARVTRIARGLPAGSALEFMDEITVLRAFEGRMEL